MSGILSICEKPVHLLPPVAGPADFCAGRSFADYSCFYTLKNSLREGGLDESGSMKLLLSMDRVDLEDGYNKCFVLQKCLKQLFENV